MQRSLFFTNKNNVTGTDNEKTANNYFKTGIEKYNYKKYYSAILSFNQAIVIQPENSNYYSKRGSCKMKLLQYRKAIADFDEAIKLNSNEIYYWSERGKCKYLLNEFQNAINDFNVALQNKSPDPLSVLFRARCYQFLGKNKKALHDYNFALSCSPKNSLSITIYVSKGSICPDEGKASDDFHAATQFIPDDSAGYSYRGMAYFYLKQYDYAIKDCNISLEELESIMSLTLRGLSYYAQKNFTDAEKDFIQVKQLIPITSREYFWRGRAYQALYEMTSSQDELVAKEKSIEYRKNALNDYSSALQLQPQYPEARKYADLLEQHNSVALRNRSREITNLFCGT